jgi:hypothetical protein
MFACNGGQIGIRTGTGSYYLTSADIVSLLVERKEVPLRLGHGDADVEASVFQHPHNLGVVISVLDNAWLVPRETIAALFRGEISGCGMERIAYRGSL